MSVANALRNHRRFRKEFLKQGSRRSIGGVNVSGESVMLAAIDGEAMVVDDFGKAVSGDAALRGIKRRRMTLFPLERHLVVYQSRGGVLKDSGIAIPLAELGTIMFKVARNKKGNAVCVIRFLTSPQSSYPCILFFMDLIDVYSYDAIRKVIESIQKLTGAVLQDDSDPQILDALGLSSPLTEENARPKAPRRPKRPGRQDPFSDDGAYPYGVPSPLPRRGSMPGQVPTEQGRRPGGRRTPPMRRP